MKTARIYKISELTAYAYQIAIKEAVKKLNKAFHFKLDPKDSVSVEKTADEFGLRFTENGELICPEI